MRIFTSKVSKNEFQSEQKWAQEHQKGSQKSQNGSKRDPTEAQKVVRRAARVPKGSQNTIEKKPKQTKQKKKRKEVNLGVKIAGKMLAAPKENTCFRIFR